MARDYYEVLGISRSASAEEIKKAYRKKAMQYHPDRAGKEAESKFKEVNKAYQILSDPQKKAAYDQFGHAGVDPNAAGGFGGARGPSGASSYSGNMGGFDFSDFGFGGGIGSIFEDLFTGAFAQVQAEISIPIAQAVLGDTVQFQNQQGEKLTLKIPPGTQDGTQFRFRGRGNQTRRGRGDLIITVKVNIPRRVSREERDLYERLRKIK